MMVAIPLIYSAYLGVAESARDITVAMAAKRRPGAHVIDLVGRMETDLAGARFALDAMLAAAARGKPSVETTIAVAVARTLLARHALAAVDLAMEAAGGGAFYRDNGLERRFRDIQGARYHPMQPGQQYAYSGGLALGQDVSKVF